jgi:hypothetical protein
VFFVFEQSPWVVGVTPPINLALLYLSFSLSFYTDWVKRIYIPLPVFPLGSYIVDWELRGYTPNKSH